MKNKSFLIITFFLLISIPINNSFSQQLNKSFEDIGGGSGSSNTSVDSNDDYILYIVGGAVIAGIVIYTLLKDKKEKPTIDTTAVTLNEKFLAQNLSFNQKVLNLQSQIPINISFGSLSDKINRGEKRYYIGLSCKF